ncbi:hypothetical protein E2562_012514 [Oryza meyeriana var. granulata]|uniref:Uncharacterized protein n=1 Tax=Oryza meyeriana var. granulata TaxID=110450 RepID=A0A6G1BXE7_9ORYZ|nr:hypothetical protein E2562_012514 [Oryza meyeriana var. granulata]
MNKTTIVDKPNRFQIQHRFLTVADTFNELFISILRCTLRTAEGRKQGNLCSCAEHMEKQDQHVIDVPSILAQELSVELASLKPSTEQAGGDSAPTPITIDKVGDLTRNVDPHEYVPHHVSIGPYNRISYPGLARDADKVRRLQEVLTAAAADSTAPLQLKDFLTELELLEGRARTCYAHSFNIPSKEFLRWLLFDGCYILVRFGDVVRRSPAAAPADGVVQVQRGNRVVPSVERKASAVDQRQQREAVDVVRDVFYLAENQIPFFVVDKIHQMTFLDCNTPALDAIARYAGELLEQKQYSVATPTKVVPPERPPEPANLLHLLHLHFKPTVFTSATGSHGSGGSGRPVGRWRTAMEYYFVGVRFKKRPLNLFFKGGALCILDVKVSCCGGTLEVPQLNIDAETWRLLRNLMALEQCNPDAAGSHVTAYCVFMSQLAGTPRDVELLVRRGVIVHGLGNHGEVAQCFADLCKGVVFDVDDADQNYLRAVCQTLDRRFRSRPRRWMAWLKQKYFANPWLAAGLVAATVIFVCTVIQAVYSVLSYRK